MGLEENKRGAGAERGGEERKEEERGSGERRRVGVEEKGMEGRGGENIDQLYGKYNCVGQRYDRLRNVMFCFFVPDILSLGKPV